MAALRALGALCLAGTAHWWWYGGDATLARLGDQFLEPLRGSAPGRLLGGASPRKARPDLAGRIVKVVDGDTVSLLDGARRQHRLRLYGIDAPEWDQPHGEEAKGALRKRVEQQEVTAVVVDRDSLDRIVAVIYVDDRNVNLELVRGGHAWWYEYFAPDSQALEQAQQEARAKKRGLWNGARPVPPWDWRRGER